jgi:hypothetical protein
MASDFSSIGFEGVTFDQIKALAETAIERGRAVEVPSGTYVVWPEPGEQLWVHVRRGVIAGLEPHFAGPARLRAAIVGSRRDPEHVMEGSISVWVDPQDDDPESGTYPFDADVPDFDVSAGRLQPPVVAELQVAAFARHLECWQNESEYEAGQRERWGTGFGRGFAPQSFVPGSVLGAATGSGSSTSQAEAFFTGVVLAADHRVNRHTGRRFWHVHTRSLAGEYDVVADPEVVEGEPRVGGVVQGTFWLSARLTIIPA